MTYTHTLTKIGNSYQLKCNSDKEQSLTIKDWQRIRGILTRKGILDTTQGLEILPDHQGHIDHALILQDGVIS